MQKSISKNTRIRTHRHGMCMCTEIEPIVAKKKYFFKKKKWKFARKFKECRHLQLRRLAKDFDVKIKIKTLNATKKGERNGQNMFIRSTRSVFSHPLFCLFGARKLLFFSCLIETMHAEYMGVTHYVKFFRFFLLCFSVPLSFSVNFLLRSIAVFLTRTVANGMGGTTRSPGSDKKLGRNVQLKQSSTSIRLRVRYMHPRIILRMPNAHRIRSTNFVLFARECLEVPYSTFPVELFIQDYSASRIHTRNHVGFGPDFAFTYNCPFFRSVLLFRLLSKLFA